ncbi:EF-hand domain-containing protein 1-like [Sycon ciliatum]|uniref:EF-hand domain-containing protein 1-like n=1 Tax=Sycon ciliatum TaxID=27933 RepID=UPI0020A855C5|eukprot:scpid61658/ scgid24735/ EF-hand domain-containing protein 1; Myoclonin-1
MTSTQTSGAPHAVQGLGQPPEPLLQTAGLPFLPGNSFKDPTKARYHVDQTLSYRNGYALPKVRPNCGIGGDDIPFNQLTPAELDELARLRPTLTYGETKPPQPVTFVPAHVAFDKKVLLYNAYFQETVHESAQEYYRVRIVKIYYYLEDGSISVTEPIVENSGIPQGKLIKRQRLPKDMQGGYWHWKDLNLRMDVNFYGRMFHVYDCDHYTRNYLESQGIVVEAAEDPPSDPYMQTRIPLTYSHVTQPDFDKLRQFMTMDRKVLRFHAIWDDRGEMFGDARHFIIHYYLVDDTLEVREVRKQNDGYDPFPALIGRAKIAKNPFDVNRDFPTITMELSDYEVKEYFTPADFRIGDTVKINGRSFLLYSCDEFTKDYYRKHFGITDFEPLDVETPSTRGPGQTERSFPPHTGIGALDDTRENCLHLIPQPPKTDVVKFLERDGQVLCYLARLESRHPEDERRRFIIYYHLNNDTISIDEPVQRNSGILGGKFLRRTRVPKKGQPFVKAGIVDHPEYYTAADFAIGAQIEIFKHRFILLDAAGCVLEFVKALWGDGVPEETIASLEVSQEQKMTKARRQDDD